MIKADMKCSSVAAASVLAKVERDDLMVGLSADHPAYGWRLNKGYAAPEHMDAIARIGPCELHRRSWRLPGLHEAGLLEVLNEGTDLPVPAPVPEQTATTVR
jgi:ribonuclease HII